MIKEKSNLNFTEREALVKLINYIQQERGRLMDEYTRAIRRLGELDEIERDINYTPNHSYQEEPEELISNEENSVVVNSEAEEVEETETTEEGNKEVNKRKSLFDMVREYNEKNEIGDYTEESNKQLQEEITTNVVEDDSVTNVPTREGHYMDIKLISGTVVNILKEAGRPMKIKELEQELNKRGIYHNSIYSLMYQAKQYQPKIEKASYGYYQYKF